MKKEIQLGDSLSALFFSTIVDRIKKYTKKKTESLQTFIGYRNLVPIRMEFVLIADAADKMKIILNILSDRL